MDIQESLMPREKMLRDGIETLSDVELLALFLRTGTRTQDVLTFSHSLLQRFGSLYGLLSAEIEQFADIDGIGIAKYAQLKGIAELARRYFSLRMREEPSLVTPLMTREFLQSQLTGEKREIFMVIFLDNQHRVLQAQKMFSGSIASVEVHPREIVREALKLNAAAVILAHNHPSGIAEPSRADRDITGKVGQACALLNIRLLDHLVIGHGEYTSFAERGWL